MIQKSTQHCLTFCYFSELCFSVGTLVSVWVELHGQLVESLFDLSLSGILWHTQNFIVILFSQDQLCDHQDADCKCQHRLSCCHGCGQSLQKTEVDGINWVTTVSCQQMTNVSS